MTKVRKMLDINDSNVFFSTHVIVDWLKIDKNIDQTGGKTECEVI
jgi:hypothetical protein